MHLTHIYCFPALVVWSKYVHDENLFFWQYNWKKIIMPEPKYFEHCHWSPVTVWKSLSEWFSDRQCFQMLMTPGFCSPGTMHFYDLWSELWRYGSAQDFFFQSLLLPQCEKTVEQHSKISQYWITTCSVTWTPTLQEHADYHLGCSGCFNASNVEVGLVSLLVQRTQIL